jgi:endoglucanase
MSALPFRGVSLPAYAFDKSPPYEYGRGYVMPGFDEVTGTTWLPAMLDYFVGKGMNTFPLQIQWEIAQPTDNGALAEVYMARVDRFVSECAARSVKVIITPHFKAERFGMPMLAAPFENFWKKLAIRYRGMANVYFDLMSEPARLSVASWVIAANIAIATIRAVGYDREIFVCGGGYAGARSWFETWYGEQSGTAMLRVTDPLGKIVFSTHHYLDENWSGEYPTNETVQDGLPALAALTSWARANGKKMWLGEFGTPNTVKGRAAVGVMLGHIHSNADVWLGWAWWAGGPWQKGYKMSIEPDAGADKPQMAWLAPYLAPIVPPPPVKTDVEKLTSWVLAQLDAVKAGATSGAWK